MQPRNVFVDVRVQAGGVVRGTRTDLVVKIIPIERMESFEEIVSHFQRTDYILFHPVGINQNLVRTMTGIGEI